MTNSLSKYYELEYRLAKYAEKYNITVEDIPHRADLFSLEEIRDIYNIHMEQIETLLNPEESGNVIPIGKARRIH